jgi:alanine racemase
MNTRQKNNPPSTIFVDIQKLQNNYRNILKIISPALCFAVVKANAYGLGAAPVAQALFQAGCRHFFVAYFQEAGALREALVKKNISVAYQSDQNSCQLFILNGLFLEDWCQRAYNNQYIPVLNTMETVLEWNRFAQSLGKTLPAVLHIDTGMNRLGVHYLQMREFRISNFPHISWCFWMSHPVAAETPAHMANALQKSRIRNIREQFPGIPFSYANTGALVTDRDTYMDFVRPGLGLYGIQTPLPGLYNCVTIQSTIVQVQTLSEGEGVGYDWEISLKKETRVATVSCGYADGFFFHGFPAPYYFFIQGKKVPVIGRISMDLIMIDISEVPNVSVGDTVFLFNDHLLSDFEKRGSFFIQRTLSNLGQRLERVYGPSLIERPHEPL